MYLAKDKYGVFVFKEKPVWDKEEFISDSFQEFFQVADHFGESLEIGQCAEIVGVQLGEIETHYEEVKG